MRSLSARRCQSVGRGCTSQGGDLIQGQNDLYGHRYNRDDTEGFRRLSLAIIDYNGYRYNGYRPTMGCREVSISTAWVTRARSSGLSRRLTPRCPALTRRSSSVVAD